MKTNLLLAGLFLLVFTACQRDANDLLPAKESAEKNLTAKNVVSNPESGVTTPSFSPYCATSSNGGYQICLEKANVPMPGNPGKFMWEWKFTNLNPGNGNGGTMQGLSHWSFSPGTCVPASAIVSASYSANGTSWTSFTPSLGKDPSNTCTNGVNSLLKFDFGTNGSEPSYYRLILNTQAGVGQTTAYYKSGRKTGCGSFQFWGIKCGSFPYVIGSNGTPFGS